MQKQQDMGKAHWLSMPTLVGVITLHSRHHKKPEAGV